MKIGINTIKTTALAAALAIGASAPLALAQTTGDGTAAPRAGHAWGHGHAGKAGLFFGGLDLTDAQKTQLQQMHESHKATVEPLAQQVRTMRQELWQLNNAATFDEAAAAAKLAEIAPLEAKLMGEQFRMRQEMLNVLTPDQKAKLQERKAQWQSKKGAGFGHGRHAGGVDQDNQ
jgi:protein CpxP